MIRRSLAPETLKDLVYGKAIGHIPILLSNHPEVRAVRRNNIVTEHPDTGNPVTGVRIAHWKPLLHIAARCYELTGLGCSC